MATDNGTKISVSASQVRAARALLGISQDELAAKSGVPKRTLVRFELGEGVPRQSTVEALAHTLERAGIAFIADMDVGGGDGEGVRFRQSRYLEYRPTPKQAVRDKAWADASKKAWEKRKPRVAAKEKMKDRV
ncbi:helix-turn-helix domain-containing protein [Acetobacter orientalis]|uniref:helix-turn-helix domain-containing protein n=2 Tax=Acetobacter orientalis TaxID=146474 RepID=UPI00209D01B4|nr:helix-turn-helix transcriptional regulator [Acetobacter orientalis]MCP1215096.1 helix-turn-helix domain-containing protein [Acetobacter orientalis]MCP1218679.1 helix-turn-helix domain-containing protein [Acetobacter orientalis]